MQTIRTLLLAAVLAATTVAAQAAHNTSDKGPELLGVERATVDGQQVMLASTREVKNGKEVFCHQQVESVTREVRPSEAAVLHQDKVTLVLATRCTQQ